MLHDGQPAAIAVVPGVSDGRRTEVADGEPARHGLDEHSGVAGEAGAIRRGEAEADVCFESNIPESVRGVLYLPILQLMAFYRSVKKGLNPDRPANLTAVVKLDF